MTSSLALLARTLQKGLTLLAVLAALLGLSVLAQPVALAGPSAAGGAAAPTKEGGAAVGPAEAVSSSAAASPSDAVSPSDAASPSSEETATTIEVGGLLGWHMFGSTATLGRRADAPGDPLTAAVRFGARVGIWLTHHWFLETELDVALTGLKSGHSAVTVVGLRPHLVYDILLTTVRPFVLLGPSLVLASPANPVAAVNDFQAALEVGGGVKWSIDSWWGVRADVRSQIQQGQDGPAAEFAGLVSIFGLFPAPPRPPPFVAVIIPDSDGDGLNDNLDRCPQAPGALELHGCPEVDRDGDGVLDADDRCPRAAGPKNLGGCPPGDRDGDGLLDPSDDCPDVKGPAERKGCPWPDRDGDGVPDKDDKCPAEAGRFSLQGCPRVDTDNDGFLDHEDKCPEEAGIAKYQGCPATDRDKDGVIDWDDKCPDKPGPAELLGCPSNDRDGDGVLDADDKCPSTKGVARFKGCPAPDKDGDGVPDDEDKCPKQKGVAEEAGCPLPDSDNDGVPDRFDKCPDRSGKRSARGDGCPDEIPNEVREFFGVVGSIDFETGSAILSDRSLPTLDKAADLLKRHKGFGIEISGHTDNSGAKALNVRISTQRAQAVRKYLVEHGVDGGRVKAVGFGPDRPIADNGTPEGRRANRRVEFKLVSE